MSFNPVLHYFNHIMNNNFSNLKPKFDGMSMYGNVLGIVLDRQDQFQLELFIVPKGLELIEFHVHPNVDSVELPLCGDFTFTTLGVPYKSEPLPEALKDKLPAWVGSNDLHGATWAGTGGAFLSFQYWKNQVKPTSVTQDYLLDEDDHHLSSGLKGLTEEELKQFEVIKK